MIETAEGRWIVCFNFIFVFTATLHFSTGYAQKYTGQPTWGKIFNLFYPTIIEIVCGNSDPGFSAAVTVLHLSLHDSRRNARYEAKYNHKIGDRAARLTNSMWLDISTNEGRRIEPEDSTV